MKINTLNRFCTNLPPGYVWLLIMLFYGLPVRRAYALEDSTSRANKIHQLHDQILASGNTANQLNEEDLANLPIGIVKKIGGVEYMVMIDSARFTAAGAFFNAYVSLRWAATGARLAFAAEDIAFHPGGIMASEDTRLVLVSMEPIPIGKKVQLVLPTDGSNYVSFDCTGYQAVNLKGLFEFDPEWVLPPEGSAQEKVTATFETHLADWTNFMARIDMDPFRPAKVKDITVAVTEAYVDYSDLANPESMQFPPGYEGGYAGEEALWTGFYLKSAHVAIPKQLSKTKQGVDSTGRGISLEVQNFIIDNTGFSGIMEVGELIKEEEGNLEGWKFSVSSFGLEIRQNKLVAGKMTGTIGMPLFSQDSTFAYTARLFDNDGRVGYDFTLGIDGIVLPVSALSARVTFQEGSAIRITNEGGKLVPEALLHGTLSVDNEKLALQELRFEGLTVTTVKPFLHGGHWGLSSDGGNKLGNFPITLEEVALTTTDDLLTLTVDVGLNLMDESDKGFAGHTRLAVCARAQADGGDAGAHITRWRFERVVVGEIGIAVDSKAFALQGEMTWFDEDATFGTGFRGEIQATFNPGGVNLKAIGQFGNVEGFKYWFVDGSVKFPTGIGQGLGIYGFRGGAYYHMARSQPQEDTAEEIETVLGTDDLLQVGASRSGAFYVPDRQTGLGVLAGVIIGTVPSADVFNGDATLEVAFSSQGGIRYARFMGEGYFMTSFEERAGASSPVYADLLIEYDFENKVLHGNLDVFVNIGNQDRVVLQGIHTGGLAGSAVLHFAPDEWYIHIGTPEQRIGLNFIGLAEAGAYFMVGTYLHDFPPLSSVIPAEFLSDLGDLDFMRDENALASGGGIAFGSSLSVNTGRLQMLMFYGQFSAGVGFDVMLRNYGDAHCVGRTDPIGIHGWYAAGQAWAYLQGAIGIRVNLKFIKGEFEIFRAGVAAIIQAKLPNPVWMRGAVAGYYSILGGLVNGNFNFNVTIGEECEIADLAEVGIQAIAGMQPAEGDEAVDVFAAPQVAFNVAVGREFETLNADNEYKAYRLTCDAMNVTQNGHDIPGELQWNDRHDVVIFNAYEILPPQKTLTATVKVHWEEKVNGRWERVADGEEQMRVTFTTGEAPDYIPEENVLYSYPVTSQYSFLQDEYGQGYLILKRGQAYLFEATGGGFTFEARFIPPGQTEGPHVPIQYNASARKVSFNLPTLQNETPYTYELVKQPVTGLQRLDKNVHALTARVADAAGGNVQLTTQAIDGTLVLAEAKILYESIFRTSRYNTFREKIAALENYQSVGAIIESHHVMRIGGMAYTPELFDKMEVQGYQEMPPLVHATALPANSWYQHHIFPMVYEHAGEAGLTVANWRTVDAPYGMPPLDAVYIQQQEAYPSLPRHEATTAAYTQGGTVTFVYDLPYTMYMDFDELRQQAFNQYTAHYDMAPLGARLLMNGSWYNLGSGQYQYTLTYTLPGLDYVTSVQTLSIDW